MSKGLLKATAATGFVPAPFVEQRSIFQAQAGSNLQIVHAGEDLPNINAANAKLSFKSNLDTDLHIEGCSQTTSGFASVQTCRLQGSRLGVGQVLCHKHGAQGKASQKEGRLGVDALYVEYSSMHV